MVKRKLNKLDFTKLSLRDLAMLAALLEHKRIAPVADAFRVSPSAVSYALDRLRATLNNELLVRTHNGFRPTPEAIAYGAKITRFLNEVQTISAPSVFDPLTAKCQISVVATEYELSTLLRATLPRLLAAGPNIDLRIIQTSRHLSLDRLHEDIDLAFVPETVSVAGIEQEVLFDDPYRVFFDPAHGFDGDLESYCQARHAVMDPNGDRFTDIDTVLAQHGRTRRTPLVAPSFQILADLMRGSPLIATLPAAFANGTFDGFQSCTPPITLPPMPVTLCYARSKSTDPKLLWVLAQLRNTLTGKPDNEQSHSGL